MKLRSLGYVAVLSALLGGCSASTNVTSTNETPQLVSSIETAEPKSSSSQSETTLSDIRLSKREVAAELEKVLNEKFPNASVYYNEEYGWFQADIIHDGAAALTVFASMNAELKTAWDGVIDAMVTLNRSMMKVVSSADYSDSVVLMLLNDENTNKVLVSIMDGVVISNAAE